eukprot:sb/3477706/
MHLLPSPMMSKRVYSKHDLPFRKLSLKFTYLFPNYSEITFFRVPQVRFGSARASGATSPAMKTKLPTPTVFRAGRRVEQGPKCKEGLEHNKSPQQLTVKDLPEVDC